MNKFLNFLFYAPISPFIASTKTIPNIDPPNAKYIILHTTKNHLLFAKNSDENSVRRAHCNMHNPGSMNMKTAERLPSTLMTPPMFGITRANISDDTNHSVTQT